MSMTLRHHGLPEGVKRFDVLNALEAAKDIYGLEEIDLRYLRRALCKVSEHDCQKGKICGFWVSVAKLSDSLGTNTRRVNRIETRLQDAGFIERSTLPNRRRWGSRNEKGEIEALAGINLAPLLNRAEEIIEAARAVATTNNSLDALRKEFVALIRKVRNLKSREAVEAMYSVDKRLRATEINNTKRLETILAGLTAILENFSASPPSRTNEAPQSEPNVRPNTYRQRFSKNRRIAPWQFIQLASSEFLDALKLYGAEDWRGIVRASEDYAKVIGISRRQWRDRCNELGEELTCQCLLIADRNAQRSPFHKYHARNAAAAFNGMAYKEAREEGVLQILRSELLEYLAKQCGAAP